MNLRKILSLIVSSAMLTSIFTAPTANAVTTVSVPKSETVLAEAEDTPSAAAATAGITTTARGTTAVASTTTTTVNGHDVISPSSGSYGEFLKWTLDSDGVLTISGNGPMPDSCIEDYYSDTKKATKVVISDGVTSIGDYAFIEFHDLKSVSIPDTVTRIGKCALAFCYGIKSIDIPASVVSLGEGALSYCAGFESITIPSSVTEIEDYTFSYSKNLKTVVLPDTITSIGDLAFSGCDKLESVNIPDSVVRIGECAFSDCISLRSITVPDSVRSISEDAFSGCINLESVSLPEDLSVAVTTVAASGTNNTTTTTSLTTNAVKTTLTTSDLKSITTQTVFDFKEVVSYPTKTVYEVGEELDLNGLVIAATWCLDENYIWKTYFSDNDRRLFWVADENGTKGNGDCLDHLPAGEYTVSYNSVRGSEYSSHYIRNVEFSFPVTIKERVVNTGTNLTATTSTTTTTTTSTTGVRTDFCTRGYNTFESVVSYPTKTVYEVGEDLDISGLVISIGNNYTYNEDVFSIGCFDVIDKDGNKVDGRQFNTLHAGEYTVISINRLYPDNMPVIIDDVDVSYKVTIKEKGKTTAVTAASATTFSTTTTAYINRGSISITPPTKQVYNIGEKLDLSGGKAIASGGVVTSSGRVIVNWDQFSATPLDSDMWQIDSSEFDNTKPGRYKIYVIYEPFTGYEANNKLISYFTVDVVDENGIVPGTNTTTIQTTTTTTTGNYDRFRRVVSYPTKTEYKEGEKLDISGLRFITSPNSDKNNETVHGIGYFRVSDFNVSKINGKAVSGDMFSDLTPGYYIVSFKGSIYGDDGFMCPDVRLSYIVTIDSSKGVPTYSEAKSSFLWGDVNGDGGVDMADAVLIMQRLANPKKYGLSGTDPRRITKLGTLRSDVDATAKGITSNDAQKIQEYLLGKIPTLDPIY